MVYQQPTGARDLLPREVAQKIWIERRLEARFRRWGYHRIITSTLERLDTLMAGGAIKRSSVIQLQTNEDEELGLRPELTASIARAVVTRMAGTQWPQRLFYNANVFRKSSEEGHGSQQEFYQAGVELLGISGVLADAETLLLLFECLNALGLKEWHLILGEAGLTRSILANFPTNIREEVRKAIAHLDRVKLENLPLSPELKANALLLFDLRGKPADVLTKVSQLQLEPSQIEALNNLKSLIDLLENSPHKGISLQLDLSLIQTIDYYTGIVFEVISDSDSSPRILGQGGRYDQLLGLYNPQGQSYPGVGFCLHIENLQQVLLSQPEMNLPIETPKIDWLVVPETFNANAHAFAYAQKLRESVDLLRVEIELGQKDTPDEVREYALSRDINQIAWVNHQGEVKLEKL